MDNKVTKEFLEKNSFVFTNEFTGEYRWQHENRNFPEFDNEIIGNLTEAQFFCTIIHELDRLLFEKEQAGYI